MAVTEPGGNDGCATQAPSAIESAFGGLRTEMDELDRRLSHLIERISPILGPALPTKGDLAGEERASGSDIAGKVRGIQNNIQSHINSINDAIQRLEV